MHIQAELNDTRLKQLVLEYLKESLGPVGESLTTNDVHIETKSKQNYRSEWEVAAFRARVDKHI